MDEFTEIAKWYIGWVDDDGKPCFEITSFVEVENKYFEGYNIPRKVINDKMEPFDMSYNRVKRWFKLPMKDRKALVD